MGIETPRMVRVLVAGVRGRRIGIIGRLGRVEGRAEVVEGVYDAETLEAAHWCGGRGSTWLMGR